MLASTIKMLSPRRAKHSKYNIEPKKETETTTPSPDNQENYCIPSESRQFPVRIGGKRFYVDMAKLGNSSEYKKISWERRIRPEAFRIVLRIIDGDDCVLPAENMPEVLRFGAHSRVTPVLQKCWGFITSERLRQMTVDLLLEVFDVIDQEIRNSDYGQMAAAHVLKALLEHSEQNDMFNAMLMSSHKVVPYLKNGVKESKALEHKWKDMEMKADCNCAKENMSPMRLISRNGLICQSCLQQACRSCSSGLCPKAIVKNLLAPLSTSTTASPSVRPLPRSRAPSPGMPLFSPERSTTPPITCDLAQKPSTATTAKSSPNDTPRRRRRFLFANKGVA